MLIELLKEKAQVSSFRNLHCRTCPTLLPEVFYLEMFERLLIRLPLTLIGLAQTENRRGRAQECWQW